MGTLNMAPTASLIDVQHLVDRGWINPMGWHPMREGRDFSLISSLTAERKTTPLDVVMVSGTQSATGSYFPQGQRPSLFHVKIQILRCLCVICV